VVVWCWWRKCEIYRASDTACGLITKELLTFRLNSLVEGAIGVRETVRARVDVFEACVAKLELSRSYDVKAAQTHLLRGIIWTSA
jgi:hypothetical protein